MATVTSNMRSKGFTSLSSRYLLVSATALAIDYASAWFFSIMGLWVPASASLGYLIGLLVAFPFMHDFVFRVDGQSLERLPLYLASGAVGVAVTYLTSFAMSEVLGQGFHLTKIAAACVSFITIFAVRYFWVFSVR